MSAVHYGYKVMYVTSGLPGLHGAEQLYHPYMQPCDIIHPSYKSNINILPEAINSRYL